MGRGRVESARRSLQKRRRAFPSSDRFILHRVVSGRTEIHRSCPLPHHQTRAGSHRHARPGVPGERGWGIARVARNGGWQRQSRGKDALFFSVALPASHLAVPCHHGRWAGDGWGGACSRAHRARSDGADPVQRAIPDGDVWLGSTGPRSRSADEKWAKSWALLDRRQHTRFAGDQQGVASVVYHPRHRE